MKTTEYLYNIQPILLASLNYKEALELKLDSATALAQELEREMSQLVHEQSNKKYMEALPVRERLHHVYKAIEHTRNLLKEIE